MEKPFHGHTAGPLLGWMERGPVHSHTPDLWLGIRNFAVPWSCEMETEKTPGIGSPDVELVAGLTSVGFLYSVGYICNAETQTHTTKRPSSYRLYRKGRFLV